MKPGVRIVALALAILMAVTVLVGALSTLVHAADGTSISDPVVRILKAGTKNDITKKMSEKNEYALEISYYHTGTNLTADDIAKTPVTLVTSGTSEQREITMSTTGMLFMKTGRSPKATLEIENTETPGVVKCTLYISYVTYDSDGDSLDISIDKLVNNTKYQVELRNVEIPDKYINGSVTSDPGVSDPVTSDPGGNVSDDTAATAASQIVVENCIALDSAGNRIDEITKDTPSFTLEIVFADIGLQNVEARDIRAADMQAYITTAGGFRLHSSAKGRVVTASTEVDYPRFRATFPNVSWEGGDKTIGFTVFYILGDVEDSVKGEGTATLFAAKAEEEEDEDEDKDKMGVAIPKIIVSQYSYGKEVIQAGNEFTLSFSITNTSAETPLENVVVTLTPASNEAATKGPGLIVASSSNTIYIPNMAAGETQSYSVDFQARPDAEATSHLITMKSSYEYIDPQKEERIQVPDFSESIAIPVSQVDRFSLEPILESGYGQVGEESYITVNFVNKGKSTTYNITATVEIDESVSAPAQHHENLEAGNTGTIDVYLTGNEPGEFEGKVILQYEDENGNQKELETPFTFVVEEPYFPPSDPETMEPDPGMMEPPGPGTASIILFIVGGLAIALPIALYLMKRVKAKASEDFDEIF